MRPELGSFERRLARELERCVAAAESVAPEDARRELAGGANSLAALATHALAAAETHVLGALCGIDVPRDRPKEFTDPLATGALRARLASVRERIHEALDGYDGSLDDPRGGFTEVRVARDLLVHAVAHASEHAGHAELTRDLLRAGR